MPDIASLLPPNATQAMRALEHASARLSDVPVPLRELWSPDNCPAPLLPWLAWAYSVDKWSTDWTEAQKRAAIRNSLFIHRHKGTYGAVERALGSLGYSIRIIEWFNDEPRGEPFTFRLEVAIDDVGIEEPMYARIEDLVADVKNVRSHMTGIRLDARTNGALLVGAATTTGEITAIHAGDDSPISYGDAYVHAATHVTVMLASGA